MWNIMNKFTVPSSLLTQTINDMTQNAQWIVDYKTEHDDNYLSLEKQLREVKCDLYEINKKYRIAKAHFDDLLKENNNEIESLKKEIETLKENNEIKILKEEIEKLKETIKEMNKETNPPPYSPPVIEEKKIITKSKINHKEALQNLYQLEDSDAKDIITYVHESRIYYDEMYNGLYCNTNGKIYYIGKYVNKYICDADVSDEE